jgi:hypothetical protein
MTDAEKGRLRVRSLGYLAPAFREQIVVLLQMMEARGHDPVVFETLRLPALQQVYFEEGASRQRDVLKSMHAYGLAADIISQSKGWNYSQQWKDDLREICATLGITCGGLWKSIVDWPHVQWGGIPGAVPQRLIDLFNTAGLSAVWVSVGASLPGAAARPVVVAAGGTA